MIATEIPDTDSRRMRTCVHEAGHVVVARLMGAHCDGVELTIPPDDIDRAGTAYTHPPECASPVLARLAEIVILMAGESAVGIFADVHGEGMTADAHAAAERALSLTHDEESALEFALACRTIARALLQRDAVRRQIAHVAAALAADGELDAHQIEEAIRHAG